MGKENIAIFLNEVMRRRKRLPSQLATDLDVSHATVSRWLSGTDTPNVRSCKKLADYSGVSLDKVLSVVGYLPTTSKERNEWPEFREYARMKYPNELDEDLITTIEELIERKKTKNRIAQKAKNRNKL